MKKSLSLYMLAGIIGFTTPSAFASPGLCNTLFQGMAEPSNILTRADLESQLASGYESHNINAYRNYKQVLAQPDFHMDEHLKTAIMDLLGDESLSTYHKILQNALTVTEGTALTVDAIKENIYQQISKFMPTTIARQRANMLTKANITTAELMQALGKMTFEESLHALIGENGIGNIGQDTIVQRYLDAARAAGVNVSSYIGRFERGPGYGGRGGEKLYIAVDQQTKVFLEQVIGSNPHLLMHTHTPNQSTLHMRYAGKDMSYAGHYASDTNFANPYSMSDGTIVPVVPLSTTEASNTTNYFDLGGQDMKLAKFPGSYKTVNENEEVVEDYCPAGGYASCTHWIGEMGIGEKLVDTYSMPGAITQEYGGVPKALRTQSVGQFNAFVTPQYDGSNSVTRINETDRAHRLARIVWTHGRGREQLWSIVGDRGAHALSKGQWANPGWTVYNFMTHTSQERVPVVFITVPDASAPITEATLDGLKSRISAQ